MYQDNALLGEERMEAISVEIVKCSRGKRVEMQKETVGKAKTTFIRQHMVHANSRTSSGAYKGLHCSRLTRSHHIRGERLFGSTIDLISLKPSSRLFSE
jgi:hypothetical protein